MNSPMVPMDRTKTPAKSKPICFTRKQLWLTILGAQLIAIMMHDLLTPWTELLKPYLPWF